jgi:hypothetical protein
MAEACELKINAITARSGLITKRQRPARTTETVAQLADRARITGNLAEVFHRTGASTLRHRDRDPFLVNIQANINFKLKLWLACLFGLCHDIPRIWQDRFCGPVALAA